MGIWTLFGVIGMVPSLLHSGNKLVTTVTEDNDNQTAWADESAVKRGKSNAMRLEYA